VLQLFRTEEWIISSYIAIVDHEEWRTIVVPLGLGIPRRFGRNIGRKRLPKILGLTQGIIESSPENISKLTT
jgi:hypothetical protein